MYTTYYEVLIPFKRYQDAKGLCPEARRHRAIVGKGVVFLLTGKEDAEALASLTGGKVLGTIWF